MRSLEPRAQVQRVGSVTRYEWPSSARGPAGGALVLVIRDLFADDVEEVESAHLAEELEPLAQVGDGLFEVSVRAHVALEAAVLLLEVEHQARVIDDRLDLAAVADDARGGAELGNFCFLKPSNP